MRKIYLASSASDTGLTYPPRSLASTSTHTRAPPRARRRPLRPAAALFLNQSASSLGPATPARRGLPRPPHASRACLVCGRQAAPAQRAPTALRATTGSTTAAPVHVTALARRGTTVRRVQQHRWARPLAASAPLDTTAPRVQPRNRVLWVPVQHWRAKPARTALRAPRAPPTACHAPRSPVPTAPLPQQRRLASRAPCTTPAPAAPRNPSSATPPAIGAPSRARRRPPARAPRATTEPLPSRRLRRTPPALARARARRARTAPLPQRPLTAPPVRLAAPAPVAATRPSLAATPATGAPLRVLPLPPPRVSRATTGLPPAHRRTSTTRAAAPVQRVSTACPAQRRTTATRGPEPRYAPLARTAQAGLHRPPAPGSALPPPATTAKPARHLQRL